MKKLNVTLLATASAARRPATWRVMRNCMSMFEFADVSILNSETYEDAMRREIEDLAQEVVGTHALFVSDDGWITNPHLWDDSWLQYDMLGAPWPAFWGTGQRVGNTGFSLRSKRFLEASAAAVGLWNGQPGDVFQCRTLARPMTELGMKYAPVEVARKFSWEHYIEEGECGPGSFGFHGWVAGKTPEQYNKLLA